MNVEIVGNLNAILEFEDLRFLVELGAGFLRLCKIHDSMSQEEENETDTPGLNQDMFLFHNSNISFERGDERKLLEIVFEAVVSKKR